MRPSASTWDSSASTITAIARKDTGEITKDAVAWLKRNKDQRFFAFCNYNSPHEPLEPPQRFLDKIPPPDAGGPRDPMVRMYMAEAGKDDEAIGVLMHTLDELDIREEDARHRHGRSRRDALRGSRGHVEARSHADSLSPRGDQLRRDDSHSDSHVAARRVAGERGGDAACSQRRHRADHPRHREPREAGEGDGLVDDAARTRTERSGRACDLERRARDARARVREVACHLPRRKLADDLLSGGRAQSRRKREVHHGGRGALRSRRGSRGATQRGEGAPRRDGGDARAPRGGEEERAGRGERRGDRVFRGDAFGAEYK